MKIEKELKRGERYDLISFDIFDTLIERDVLNAKDIFIIVGYEVFNNYAEAILFKERRIRAERSARKKSPNGEPSLVDIYEDLYAYYGEKCELLKDQEINTEIEHCSPRNNWKQLFESFLEKGKMVVLISDMYLSSDIIKKILLKCGVSGFAKIFVSSEYGCDKISGRLYHKAEEELGFESRSHLHYGDSVKADYMGAIKANVKPRLLLKSKIVLKIVTRCIRKLPLIEKIGYK